MFFSRFLVTAKEKFPTFVITDDDNNNKWSSEHPSIFDDKSILRPTVVHQPSSREVSLVCTYTYLEAENRNSIQSLCLTCKPHYCNCELMTVLLDFSTSSLESCSRTSSSSHPQYLIHRDWLRDSNWASKTNNYENKSHLQIVCPYLVTCGVR